MNNHIFRRIFVGFLTFVTMLFYVTAYASDTPLLISSKTTAITNTDQLIKALGGSENAEVIKENDTTTISLKQHVTLTETLNIEFIENDFININTHQYSITAPKGKPLMMISSGLIRMISDHADSKMIADESAEFAIKVSGTSGLVLRTKSEVIAKGGQGIIAEENAQLTLDGVTVRANKDAIVAGGQQLNFYNATIYSDIGYGVKQIGGNGMFNDQKCGGFYICALNNEHAIFIGEQSISTDFTITNSKITSKGKAIEINGNYSIVDVNSGIQVKEISDLSAIANYKIRANIPNTSDEYSVFIFVLLAVISFVSMILCKRRIRVK